MKIRVCFELCTRDEDKNIDGIFGLAMEIGETNTGVDYGELTKSVNIGEVLRVTGLDGLVKPEDVKIITPEEYDEKYGDDDDAV